LRTLLSLILSTSAVLAASTPVASQTHAPASASPVQVKKCEPRQGRTTVSSAGYTPGYYPGSRYTWRDPYGHRYYQYPVTSTAHTTTPTLNIDYVNTGPKPLKEVEFGLVAKGHLVAEVRDVGTFSQGAEIKHSFGLSPNVFPLGTGLAQCVPLRATYEDGTTWTNPRLPQANSSIYR
jgi:hypothetical protein